MELPDNISSEFTGNEEALAIIFDLTSATELKMLLQTLKEQYPKLNLQTFVYNALVTQASMIVQTNLESQGLAPTNEMEVQ